jgi:hypothetical protein
MDLAPITFDYIFRQRGKLRHQMAVKPGATDEEGKIIPALTSKQKKAFQGSVFVYDEKTIAFSIDLADELFGKSVPTDKFYKAE